MGKLEKHMLDKIYDLKYMLIKTKRNSQQKVFFKKKKHILCVGKN